MSEYKSESKSSASSSGSHKDAGGNRDGSTIGGAEIAHDCSEKGPNCSNVVSA